MTTLPAGYTLRPATVADAERIQAQRDALFLEMGEDRARIQAVSVAGRCWLEAALGRHYYQGWLAETGGEVVAGAGLVWADMPPNPDTLLGVWAYLLNVYVQPTHRGRGLSGVLLGSAEAEARARGVNLMYLHASQAARPLYLRRGYFDNSGMEAHLLTMDGRP